MKNRRILLIATLVILSLFFVTGCGYKKKSDTDYGVKDNWAIFAVGEEKKADVFLICPTVDMNDEFNMQLTDEDTKSNFVGALNMETGLYSDVARIYAPFYHQAAMKVYSLSATDREPYMQIAYNDISDAFTWYMEHENDGRPIILAGFSQGADMCYRLLQEYFDDKKLQEQLVAVYAIGWPCDKEMVEKYPQIVPAKGEDDYGVVISFDCEAPEIEETFITPKDMKAYTINPLNWKTDSTPADKSLNKGACFVKYSGEIKSEIPGLCGCYIDESRGILKVPDVNKDDFPSVVPGLATGVYHIYDYQFFYRNLQENVKVRLDKYIQAHTEG